MWISRSFSFFPSLAGTFKSVAVLPLMSCALTHMTVTGLRMRRDSNGLVGRQGRSPRAMRSSIASRQGITSAMLSTT